MPSGRQERGAIGPGWHGWSAAGPGTGGRYCGIPVCRTKYSKRYIAVAIFCVRGYPGHRGKLRGMPARRGHAGVFKGIQGRSGMCRDVQRHPGDRGAGGQRGQAETGAAARDAQGSVIRGDQGAEEARDEGGRGAWDRRSGIQREQGASPDSPGGFSPSGMIGRTGSAAGRAGARSQDSALPAPSASFFHDGPLACPPLAAQPHPAQAPCQPCWGGIAGRWRHPARTGTPGGRRGRGGRRAGRRGPAGARPGKRPVRRQRPAIGDAAARARGPAGR